jgi:steroid 5-alpha reductase family enzyme
MPWSLSSLSIPQDLALHLALALTVSSLGFLRVVYFVSLGYAGSIAAMALLALARVGTQAPLALLMQSALLLCYGLRLGGYLMLRERHPAFRREIAEIHQRAAHIGAVKRIAIWLGVSLLYVLMFSPDLCQQWLVRGLVSGAEVPAPKTALSTWIGIPLMAAGLLLESAADAPKSAAKKRQPTRFCDVGLYRWVRCPNYLGEIVFWMGNFSAGLSAYSALWQGVAAAAGLLCIVLIMMGSTKRLESKQDERYGDDPDYQRYVATVPVLFPWLPIYSLKGIRVYLE